MRDPVRPEVEDKDLEVLGSTAEEEEVLDIDDVEEDAEQHAEGGEVERRGPQDDRRALRGLLDPRRPSQKEVDDHELTHLPYRNWCDICVKCKGKYLDHRKAVEEEGVYRAMLLTIVSLATSSDSSSHFSKAKRR